MQGSKGGGGTHQAADACADDAEGQGLGERCSRQEGGRHVCRGHAEEGAGAETGGPAGRASLECEGWWTARCARQLLLSARSRLRARRLRSQPRLCFLAATPIKLHTVFLTKSRTSRLRSGARRKCETAALVRRPRARRLGRLERRGQCAESSRRRAGRNCTSSLRGALQCSVQLGGKAARALTELLRPTLHCAGDSGERAPRVLLLALLRLPVLVELSTSRTSLRSSAPPRRRRQRPRAHCAAGATHGPFSPDGGGRGHRVDISPVRVRASASAVSSFSCDFGWRRDACTERRRCISVAGTHGRCEGTRPTARLGSACARACHRDGRTHAQPSRRLCVRRGAERPAQLPRPERISRTTLSSCLGLDPCSSGAGYLPSMSSLLNRGADGPSPIKRGSPLAPQVLDQPPPRAGSFAHPRRPHLPSTRRTLELISPRR